MKDKNKIDNLELEKALNKIKTDKEDRGIIPKNDKKIIIIKI